MFTYYYFKRVVDIITALLGLVVVSPLLAIAIVLLLLSGETSPILMQYRVGVGAKLFRFYKLRTMKRDKDGFSSSLTLANDNRVTFLGRVLRATKIDELPQLFNVINGDLSLVGPRALMPEIFAHYLREDQLIIGSIRPGVTGLGSVIFRNEQYLLRKFSEPSEKTYKERIAPAKAELEKWYISRQGFFLDVKILVITLWLLFYSRSKIAWRLIGRLPKKVLWVKHPDQIL